MIAAVPLLERDIRAAMDSEGLAALTDLVLASALPACELELAPVADDHDAPVGSSRFGGAPDLPPHFKWPRRAGSRFLTFIAQFSTGDLHRCGLTHVPAGGLLSFFYDLDPAVNGHSLDDFDAFRVLFFPDPGTLARFPRPQPVRDPSPSPQPTIPAGSMRLVPTLTVPRSLPQPLDDDCAARWSRVAYRLAEHRPAPRHLLCGHPDLLQDNLLWTCARYRAGIGTLRLRGLHPACEDAKLEAQHWRLLLQIETDRRFDLCFTAAGMLYFCARGLSLPLDRVWACSLCD